MSRQKDSISRVVSMIPIWQGILSIGASFNGTNWFALFLIIAVVEWLINKLFVRVTSRFRYLQLLLLVEAGLCLSLGLAALLSLLGSFRFWHVGLAILAVFAWGGVVINRWIQSLLQQGVILSDKVSLFERQQRIQKADWEARQSKDPRIRLLANLAPVVLGLTYAIGAILGSKVIVSAFVGLLAMNAGTLYYFVDQWRGYRLTVEWEQQTGQERIVQEIEDLKK